MTLPKRSKKRQAMIDDGTHQPPKRKLMRKRAKNNIGWIDVAEEIWNERKHVCEVCKVYIANPSPANFSHLFPRSTYPELKRDKRNIRIKCQKCHDLWHKHGPDALQWSTGWTKVCAIYFALRDAARGITK